MKKKPHPLYQVAAARAKAAREGKGLTQDQVAKLTGFGQTTVSYYELGRRKIDLPIAETFARAFGDAGPPEWFAGAVDRRTAEIICAARGEVCRIYEPRSHDENLTSYEFKGRGGGPTISHRNRSRRA